MQEAAERLTTPHSSPTRMWRLNPAALIGGLPYPPLRLEVPAAFVQQLRSRNGLVVGAWDAAAELAQVSALGVVRSVDGAGAMIDWRLVELEFRPNSTGRAHWSKQKPYFEFKDPVRSRYMLDDLFAEHFPEFGEVELSRSRPLPVARATNSPISGFVYVIHSEHGYKIGKTINLKNRTRLFSVKLPFPISIEHYAWFDDYTAAERRFHLMFHTKRKEGEWFALDENDLRTIKTFGKRVTVAGL